jgi:hypothetical protein
LANSIAATPTFGDYADSDITEHESGWRNAKHIAQWRMALRVYAAPIRAIPINQISVDHVLSVPTETGRPNNPGVRRRGVLDPNQLPSRPLWLRWLVFEGLGFLERC